MLSSENCEWASLSVTILPQDFIAARDRPYLDQLSKRQRSIGQLRDWLLRPWYWLFPHQEQ